MKSRQRESLCLYLRHLIRSHSLTACYFSHVARRTLLLAHCHSPRAVGITAADNCSSMMLAGCGRDSYLLGPQPLLSSWTDCEDVASNAIQSDGNFKNISGNCITRALDTAC